MRPRSRHQDHTQQWYWYCYGSLHARLLHTEFEGLVCVEEHLPLPVICHQEFLVFIHIAAFFPTLVKQDI